MKKSVNKLLLLTAVTCLSAGTANAAGFYIQEQSVSGLGAGFAGAAAMPRDASILYFNAAGMTYLDGRNGNIGVHALAPHSDLDDTGSTPPPTGVPLGGDTANPYDIEFVPNLHYSHQLNDKWWAGVSVTAPFGLVNEYDDDYFARFDSISSELLTINVQPSIATKLTDRLSFGAGIDIQYVDAELKSAVPLVPGPPGAEGVSTLEGDDISFGYNLGFMYDMTDQTRLGLQYRSQVNHKLDGSVNVTGAGLNSDGVANLNLPEIANFSVAHQLDDQWTLLGGATWFGWSNYERITVNAENDALDNTVEQNYKNTWAFNLGAEYEYSPEWTFRTGAQYDQTPTQDGFRSTRTPDGDRIWVSGGATYTMNDNMSWDFAVTGVHVADEEIDLTRSGGTIDADSSGWVGIMAVGLNYKF